MYIVRINDKIDELMRTGKEVWPKELLAEGMYCAFSQTAGTRNCYAKFCIHALAQKLQLININDV